MAAAGGAVAMLLAGVWGGMWLRAHAASPDRAERRSVDASRLAAIAYALFGLMTVGCTVFINPPFTVPDETDHLRRAAFVLTLLPAPLERRGAECGARLPDWIEQTVRAVYPTFAPAQRAFAHLVDDDWAQAQAGHVPADKQIWRRGTLEAYKNVPRSRARSWQRFPNTAVYPATFYLPQAAALGVARAVHARPFVTIAATRLFNGMCGVGLGALAIAWSPSCGALFAVLLCLPLSVHQLASASPDATCIPFAMLLAAGFERLARTPRWPRGWLVAWLTGVAAFAQAKLPMLSLYALLPALLRHPAAGRKAKRTLCLSAALGVLASIGWAAWVHHQQIVLRSDMPGSVGVQCRRLLTDPAHFCVAFWHTLRVAHWGYADTMVGVLGWLDVGMPAACIRLGQVAVLAALLACSVNMAPLPRWSQAAAALASVGAFVLAHVIFYVTWTPPDIDIVHGFQGRYILYMLPFWPLAIGALPHMSRLGPMLRMVAFVSTIGSLAPLPWVLLRAYYLAD